MAQNPLEQLQHLSDEIRQEEQALWFDLLGGLFDPEAAPDMRSDDLKQRKEWSARLLLRALRIRLCLELMDYAPRQCRKQLLEDWADAAETVRKLSRSLDITGEVLSDTLDLVLLLSPGSRQPLLRQLDLSTRLKIRKICPLSAEVNQIARDMANYCLETDRMEIVRSITKQLILLGESRNQDYPQLQRILVVGTLVNIVDLDRPLTVQLCESQQKYFKDTVDAFACDFYWFYGFSVLSLNDPVLAATLLKHCYDLCMAVEGETSWIGARAGSIYHYSLLKTDRHDAAVTYLLDTLEKIDRGFYPNMDDNAPFTAAYTRFMLLNVHMESSTLIGWLPHIERLLEYCIAAEETNISPYLTIRRAEVYLSSYYREKGDYLQAAEHQRRALEAVPKNGLPAIPSDVLIYTNLLQIYTDLRDPDQVRYYSDKVLEYEEELNSDSYLANRVTTLLNNAATLFVADEDDMENAHNYLESVYLDIVNDNLHPPETGRDSFVWSILTALTDLLDSGTASREDLLRLRYIVEYFWGHPEIYVFNEKQNLTYYLFLTSIEAQLDSPKALDYLAMALQRMDILSEVRAPRITMMRSAVIVCYHFRNQAQAMALAQETLGSITSAWQKAVSYLNDRRICQLLASVQDDFRFCYAVLRETLSSEELYERILRFKDLPALVGRERNTFLRLAPVDESLHCRISALQDKLAADEMNDSLRGTDTARETAAKLERLEAEFAAGFPRTLRFTEITFQGVCEKLPENHAIVEYYFVPGRSSISLRAVETRELELDIFVTTKTAGQVRFHHLICPDAARILDAAGDFIEILQDPDDLSASGRKAQLRANLYRQLISPVLPLLEGITQLYIAPDESLCNLPFEILYGQDRVPLQDRYRICRLVCGRDLLFYDDETPSGGGSFILGNPNYEAQRGQRSHSRIRSGQGNLEPVDALPFSGVEAKRVARRCRSNVCTGDAATKYALRDALPARIIHLATHGAYDESMEADSLYASHLVFAGYNQWARNQTESSHCGNGILTADEISRMDLRKTELVVLSACQSGLGDTSYGTVRGLLSAFSAAGARWVVSHLWAASDFATPILMDAFYNALQKQGQEVPEALQYAKNHLKTVTIGQLRRDGWLELPRDIDFPAEIRGAVEEMNLLPDREMPFQDEFYWGGFTVHKSR